LAKDVLDMGRIRTARIALANPTIFLQYFTSVLVDVSFDRLYLSFGKRWHDFQNLLVRAAQLEIGHQILHGDATGRELWAAATIDDRDLSIHGWHPMETRPLSILP